MAADMLRLFVDLLRSMAVDLLRMVEIVSVPHADLLRLMVVDLLRLVADLAPFVDLLRLMPALETVFVPSADLLRLNVSRDSFVDLLMK